MSTLRGCDPRTRYRYTNANATLSVSLGVYSLPDATRVRLIRGAIASVNQTTLWLPRISLPTRTLETCGFP
ncbi:MAG: hypothetical protein ACYTX0_52655, partial [Nostoc sp.]